MRLFEYVLCVFSDVEENVEVNSVCEVGRVEGEMCDGEEGTLLGLKEAGLDEIYLADVVDQSCEEALMRYGPNAVFMGAEEVQKFMFGYKWRPMTTDWVDPEVGETVLGNELADWVFDCRRVDEEGKWVRMVSGSRKRVPEPGSRESFEAMVRRSELCGWTTYTAAGCLMIRFRELRLTWKEGDCWIRNEDPKAGLVLSEDGR